MLSGRLKNPELNSFGIIIITRFCVTLHVPSHYTIVIGLNDEHKTINLRPRVDNNDVVIKTVASLVLSLVTA